MPETLNDLLDIANIKALRVSFGHSVDTRQFDALEPLFTEHVEADLSAFGIPAGRLARADLIGIFQHSFRHAHVATLQTYSNFQIRVDGQSALMISCLHGHHAGSGFNGGNSFDLWARYHDRLVCDDGSWKIWATRLEVISMEGNLELVS